MPYQNIGHARPFWPPPGSRPILARPSAPAPIFAKSRAKRRRGNRPPKNWQRANWAPSIKGRQRNFLVGSFTFLFSSQANTQERVEGKICSYRQGRRIPATIRASPAAAGVALSLVLISQSTHGQQLKSPSIPPDPLFSWPDLLQSDLFNW